MFQPNEIHKLNYDKLKEDSEMFQKVSGVSTKDFDKVYFEIRNKIESNKINVKRSFSKQDLQNKILALVMYCCTYNSQKYIADQLGFSNHMYVYRLLNNGLGLLVSEAIDQLGIKRTRRIKSKKVEQISYDKLKEDSEMFQKVSGVSTKDFEKVYLEVRSKIKSNVIQVELTDLKNKILALVMYCCTYNSQKYIADQLGFSNHMYVYRLLNNGLGLLVREAINQLGIKRTRRIKSKKVPQISYDKLKENPVVFEKTSGVSIDNFDKICVEVRNNIEKSYNKASFISLKRISFENKILALLMYYLRDDTQLCIGNSLGFNRMYVSQLLNNGLGFLVIEAMDQLKIRKNENAQMSYDKLKEDSGMFQKVSGVSTKDFDKVYLEVRSKIKSNVIQVELTDLKNKILALLMYYCTNNSQEYIADQFGFRKHEIITLLNNGLGALVKKALDKELFYDDVRELLEEDKEMSNITGDRVEELTMRTRDTSPDKQLKVESHIPNTQITSPFAETSQKSKIIFTTF